MRPRCDNFKRKQDEKIATLLSFSTPLNRVRALFQEWIRDGKINLPYVSRPPTAKKKSNPHYCNYHYAVSHPFTECKNMRKIFHRRTQIKEVLIGNNKFQNNPLPTHHNA